MKQASSSQLKSHMGRYIAALRRGEGVVVTDRGIPVGRLLPLTETARVRAPLRLARARTPGAPALGTLSWPSLDIVGTDSTAALREDRARR